MAENNDLTVFISSQESTCDECKSELGRDAWIMLKENRAALCLSCAELDHLVFLQPGNAALTRRARKYSTLAAVVLKWAKRRHRYERQGLLVEEEALDRAAQECLADADVRERRREREAVKRGELDLVYVERFAARVRELYPDCPPGREKTIAEHACQKYSGRVGRSASAKALDDQAVRFAVIAHIRHQETNYDELLAVAWDRAAARAAIAAKVDKVLHSWKTAR